MKNDIKKAPKKTSKVVTSSGKGVKITKREVLPFAVEEIITKEKTLKQKLADQKAEISVLWTTVVVLTIIVIGQALIK